MPTRRPALVTLGVTLLLALVATPASSASVSSASTASASAAAVRAVVALLHHDQQGIVLAHQAEAQSPDPTTRARAATLAASHRRQAAGLMAVLDRWRVPARRRLVDTTATVADRLGAMGCDLMPRDAVSRLASSPAAVFDAEFRALMQRHLDAGGLMAGRVRRLSTLRRTDRLDLERSQRSLAT